MSKLFGQLLCPIYTNVLNFGSVVSESGTITVYGTKNSSEALDLMTPDGILHRPFVVYGLT